MKHINFQSDFKIREVAATVDAATPFRYIYRTFGSKSYTASFDGNEYTNCRRLDDGSVLIVFDQPCFQTGILRVRREFYLNDTDFRDGILNLVTVENLDIRIVSGETDDADVTVEVYPNYQKGDKGEKGDPFTYDDFTPEQLAALQKLTSEEASQTEYPDINF